MPPVNLLIKPASSKCNMRCRYCFYSAIADAREIPDYGIMGEETLRQVIRRGIDYADYIASFAFQGGEPTVAGLGFFEKAVELQKDYIRETGRKDLRIRNAIQTNGFVIDEKWASFFRDNHFLVGLSLDGPVNVHDKNRVDKAGNGTFERVMHAAELFDCFGVDYNILSVVTGQNAMAIRRIYRFLTQRKFRYLQFIPCLEPIEKERGSEAFHLSVQEYGDFLIDIFDLWFSDLEGGKYTSIRHIDNWIGMFLGERPEACNMTGRCSVQFVVEGDGSVYPCDFYVFDRWRLGNVRDESLDSLIRTKTAAEFVEGSVQVPEECRSCRFLSICRNGCRRDRIVREEGSIGKNYYCNAFRRFFSEREADIKKAVGMILQLRQKNPYRL